MRITKKTLLLASAALFLGCSGDDGDVGPAGPPAADAVDSGTIQGTVLDIGGSAVPDATIQIDPPTQTVTSDVNGFFVLGDIPIGSYRLAAERQGVGSAFLTVGVAGGGTVSVALTLTAQNGETGAISGVVLDVNGKAIPNAAVAVEGESGKVTTATDGSFTISDVTPGFAFLQVTSPNAQYLDGETRESLLVEGGSTLSGVEVVLSGRPSDAATYVGGAVCQLCHGSEYPRLFSALDGSPDAVAHSRFIVEGTDNMVYPGLWPSPGDAYQPRDPSGDLLMVKDPLDGKGLVNLALCTEGAGVDRSFTFKFFAELPSGSPPRTLDELNCDPDDTAVFIPVTATIGGQGNWGEGYTDPAHALPDRHPNFGEGKQRFMARIQDVPYLVDWMTENNVPLDRAKQDYVPFLPVYVVQGGTDGPKFWQKSPTSWVSPDNTLSRNCAGCHATGVKITTRDFLDNPDHQFKSVVTSFDYKDLNITCEQCHGPGSEHVASVDASKLIMPQYLTAKAASETCGQCHGAHGGKSDNPLGVHKYPFNAAKENSVGNGFFVPGIYELEDFYHKFNQAVPTVADDWNQGSFHSWPDQTHSRVHSQMLPELLRSAHYNNSLNKLTCSSCHDPHTMDAGPASMQVNGYDFENAAFGNNAMCLTCHATRGSFADIAVADVAVLQKDAGRNVTLDGEPVAFENGQAALARNRIERAVTQHMQDGAGMGGAPYTPEDQASPVGNCASCHMAKLGKQQDVNDDGQWDLLPDQDGLSAMAQGNVASHVFDIVWPAQSAALARTATKDHEIMPNSCSNCHDFARFSGDGD